MATKTTSRDLMNTSPSRCFGMSAGRRVSMSACCSRCLPTLRCSFLLATGSVSLCGLGQDAVGGEGHLLSGDAGYRLSSVAGYHDDEIGVSGVTCAFGEDDSGVGEGGSVVADLV